MSGQWEVVGKSKTNKQTGKSKKLSKTEMQKFVDNAPKVEDLCKYPHIMNKVNLLSSYLLSY